MVKKNIGHQIPDLEIHGNPAPYHVLNERAIRATAGLMFAIGLSTMRYTVLQGDRTYMYVLVPVFWLHFVVSTLWGPEYSPIASIGNFLVSNQRPERVGSIQKRFARGIGVGMGTLMMLSLFVFDAPRYVLLAICGTCLFFMRLESAVGLCVGCKIYAWLLDAGYISMPEHRPACPGGACSIVRPS